MPSTQDVTPLLQQWSVGDKKAAEKLIPLLYKELHQIAHRYMRKERSGHTLQTTALINEAYLRLIDRESIQCQSRVHFFAVCAQLMRRILVDFACSRKNLKRGDGFHLLPLDEAPDVSQHRASEIITLDEALQRLEAIDPRKSHIVELRFFGGLTLEETAAVLKVSCRTIQREWDLAKALLHREMSAESTVLKETPAPNLH